MNPSPPVSTPNQFEDSQILHQLGDRFFRLHRPTAADRLSSKRVINGLRTPELNILPVRYPEAYRLYKQMKANHWEPEVIDMTRDVQWWNSDLLTAQERRVIELGIGYFSVAEGIIGDSVLHVIEDNLTAAELKHAALRQIAEESVHMDSLLHIVSTLNIEIDLVTTRFKEIASIQKKIEFMTRQLPDLKRGLDLTRTIDQQKFTKAIFGITQVMEGTQFYSLFAMILSLYRQNKMTGVGQMFQYTMRDETNHIAFGRFLIQQIVSENPAIWQPEFRADLVDFMREGVQLEKEFVYEVFPKDAVGLTQAGLLAYIEFTANRRLANLDLTPLTSQSENPFPWLDEVIFLRKEKNFFETRVTEYQTSGSIRNAREEDLI